MKKEKLKFHTMRFNYNLIIKFSLEVTYNDLFNFIDQICSFNII